MAITVSNVVQNHRAVSCQIVGDGSATTFSVSHNVLARPGTTITGTAFSAPTTFSRNSRAGGLLFPDGGTSVSMNTPTHVQVHPSLGSNGTISVVLPGALANATTAYVVLVFTQYTN